MFVESSLPLSKVRELEQAEPKRAKTESPSLAKAVPMPQPRSQSVQIGAAGLAENVDRIEVPQDGGKDEKAVATASSEVTTRNEIYKAENMIVKRQTTKKVLEPITTNPTYISEHDKDSEFLLFMVPNRLPEPIQSRHPLAELYYTTQTLPISKLLPAAHKTLTTDSYQLAFLEGKLSVVHARIEELKQAQKWSLRQHVKFKGPIRPKAHWDHLLDEMKWMQIDFKEERKLKVAICSEIANAVKEYWKLGKDKCCVKHKPIEYLPEDFNLEQETNYQETNDQDRDLNMGDATERDDKEEQTIEKEIKRETDTIYPKQLEDFSYKGPLNSLIPIVHKEDQGEEKIPGLKDVHEL